MTGPDSPPPPEGAAPVDDPGAPIDLLSIPDLDAAKSLANYGEAGPQHFTAAERAPAAPAMLPIVWNQVAAFLNACETSHPRVAYGLGAKVPGDGAVPGRDFTRVDCSGFVRAAIRRSTHPEATAFPDGSVNQHDWVKTHGFASQTIADGKLGDGKVRIAFLDPHATSSGIGHVVLIRNGKTAESHGGVGPDSRPFDGSSWQAKTRVYLLA